MNKLQTFFWAGKILALDEHPETRPAILREIQSGRISWDLFFRTCDRQLMLPAIYCRFSRHGLLSCIPAELAGHLEEIYRLNSGRNEKILEQIREITLVLNGHGISPVFLKGAGHLLDNLYHDAGERFMFDIDCIVPEDDFLPAAEILENDGYIKLWTYTAEQQLEAAHYPRIVKAGCISGIEIHRLPCKKYTRHFGFSHINREKRIPAGSLAGCHVLSYRHAIIHNMINNQLSDKGYIDAIGNLRQMYDLVLLSRQADPVKSLEEFGHFRRQARAYLKLTSRVFGIPEKLSRIYSLTTFLFILRHNLNLRWRKPGYTPVTFPGMKRILQLIIVYARRIIRAMTDKPYRTEHWQMLRDGRLFRRRPGVGIRRDA